MLTIKQFILSQRCYFSSFNNCHFGNMSSYVMRNLFLATFYELNWHVCSLYVFLFLLRYCLYCCGCQCGLSIIYGLCLCRRWLIGCCRKLISLGRIGLGWSRLFFRIGLNTFLSQSLCSLACTLILLSYHYLMGFIMFVSFL